MAPSYGEGAQAPERAPHRAFVRLPLSPLTTHGRASVLPRVGALLRRYFRLRAHVAPEPPEFAFQLPGEVRPTTASEERWLHDALRRCDISAPPGVRVPTPGFAYRGHSMRSLGASAMAAIGMPRHVYIWIGSWAWGSSVVDRCYIDPTFFPSAAAYNNGSHRKSFPALDMRRPLSTKDAPDAAVVLLFDRRLDGCTHTHRVRAAIQTEVESEQTRELQRVLGPNLGRQPDQWRAGRQPYWSLA